MSNSHEISISVNKNIITKLQANAKVSTVYEELKNLLVAAKKDPKGDNAPPKKTPKIQKVPVVLQEQKKFEKYYEPRWISVGPIHHRKTKLMLAETQYKPKLVAKFIKDSGKEIEDLYQKIREKIKDLKECFAEDVIEEFDDDTLSWMLFYDGCSTLQFINSYVKGGHELKSFLIKSDQIAYAQQDLFLLENQIPFVVLKLLMESREDSGQLKWSVMEFVRYNVITPNKYKKNLKIENEIYSDATHLLELLWFAILHQPKGHRNGDHLRDMLCCGLVKATTFCPMNYWPLKKLRKRKDRGQPYYSFRNVQELKATGIGLKPSKSCSLADITFDSFCFTGTLNLPPLIVEESTESKFLNLIAYESCPDNFRTKGEVSSYLSFMDSLIDNEEDVKDLRSANIIRNWFSSDAEVARLFNEIGNIAVPVNTYEDEKIKMQMHYEIRCARWIVQVYRDHFSNPWTIIALIAAFIALFLTGIQTWFAYRPSK